MSDVGDLERCPFLARPEQLRRQSGPGIGQVSRRHPPSSTSTSQSSSSPALNHSFNSCTSLRPSLSVHEAVLQELNPAEQTSFSTLETESVDVISHNRSNAASSGRSDHCQDKSALRSARAPSYRRGAARAGVLRSLAIFQVYT